ncbi:alpha/beta hydrolase domain-containing protein [Herbaspirillum sp. alder98]|uniref:alpha/beta hydrolase domain-containing protein n=1 Tax=Herbaspirillum sp. alder98 TaxID=2913096 RepID=UPI001CD8BE61|nr:alpha/beta hydrolase domain-containing protein [Herbaspirillum sp. alder98]MCA1325367.1 hypothetical protein [Herbaspirillum sp. alder98]
MNRILRISLSLAAFSSCLTLPSHAGVTNIDVIRVDDAIFGGAMFGKVGSYKRIVGMATMRVDPGRKPNEDITDIHLAKRNQNGMVEYSSPFYILTPSEPAKANGKIVYDVVNRGRKAGLYLLNDAPLKDDPDVVADAGNGYLMAQGYTIVFSGWQADILNKNNLLGLNAPTLDNVKGRVTDEFIFDNSVNPAVAHLSYPAASLDTGNASLHIKEKIGDPETQPKGLAFRFVDDRSISIARPAGFDAGAIYTFSYTGKSPAVSGLGFAAVRDLVSFLRYPPATTGGAQNPLASPGFPQIKAVYGVGVSQSARFLRDMVYWGQNQDEQGRIIFDGILPYVAGSRKTLVNTRFAQPGRFSRQHEDHDFGGDQFPFSYATSTDTLTGLTDGILRRCTQSDTCPKVIQTDTDTENMQGRISLLVTTTDGRPLPVPPNVRLFYLAGYPHAALIDAVAQPTATCRFLSNPLHPGIVERALFAALDRWVVDGVNPPDSKYPSVADGTFVPAMDAGYRGIPGLDYEGKFNRLAVAAVHAKKHGAGLEYPVFVAKVDADGIALAGVHTPSIAAPVATYLGWNLRKQGYAEGELCGITGTTIAFARTKAQRLKNGDERLSLEERYPTPDAYIDAVSAAVHQLQAEKLLLQEDGEKILRKASVDALDLK